MYGAEKLSREYILSVLSQVEIMEYYLGISVQYTTLVTSPLRVDKKPTASFHVDGRGVLIFKDFNGSFYGDCFNVVERVYTLSFTEALRQIAADFNLRQRVVPTTPVPLLIPTTSLKVIEIKRQHWTKQDIAYWTTFGIRSNTLRTYRVSSVANAWVDDRLVYSYRPTDLGYAYEFGEGVVKLYFPLRSNYRFLSNVSVLQGMDQLPATGTLLLITKSLKDVMLLHQYGIAAVAPSAESTIPGKDEMQELRLRFASIYSFYDFDYAGVRGARKMRKAYNISPLFLTNGRFKSINYQAKDLTDFRKHFGEAATTSLIYSLLEWQDQANASF